MFGIYYINKINVCNKLIVLLESNCVRLLVPLSIRISYTNSFKSNKCISIIITTSYFKGLYKQEKACKQEERLINRLQALTPSVPTVCNNLLLIDTIRREAYLLLEMGETSGLGKHIHRESVPMHTLAKYLFGVLLPHDRELAFKIGLRAVRLPILEEIDMSTLSHSQNVALDKRENVSNGILTNRSSTRHRHRRYGIIGGVNNENDLEARNTTRNFMLASAEIPRWYTLGHIEVEQCTLASTILHAAKGI